VTAPSNGKGPPPRARVNARPFAAPYARRKLPVFPPDHSRDQRHREGTWWTRSKTGFFGLGINAFVGPNLQVSGFAAGWQSRMVQVLASFGDGKGGPSQGGVIPKDEACRNESCRELPHN
jgi:hypothetical protein